MFSWQYCCCILNIVSEIPLINKSQDLNDILIQEVTSYVMREQQHKNQKALAMDFMSSVMSLCKTEIVQKSVWAWTKPI